MSVISNIKTKLSLWKQIFVWSGDKALRSVDLEMSGEPQALASGYKSG